MSGDGDGSDNYDDEIEDRHLNARLVSALGRIRDLLLRVDKLIVHEDDGRMRLSWAKLDGAEHNYVDVAFDVGLSILQDVLRRSNALEELCCWELGRDAAALVIGPLTCALANNCSLRVLRFVGECCKIGDGAVRRLSAKIGDDGARRLSGALKVNKTLERLDLRWHVIGAAGAKCIASALTQNESLLVLHLIGNDIGDEGGKSVADALGFNTGLRKIFLCNNEMGDETARSLAASLMINRSVQQITVWSNNITDRGARNLLFALGHNDVVKISLNSNQISSDIVDAVKAICKDPKVRRVVNQFSCTELPEEQNVVTRVGQKGNLLRNLRSHNTVLRPSDIHGIGVFALSPIPRGTKLFRFNGEPNSRTVSLTQRDISSLPEHVQTSVRDFILPDEHGLYHVPEHGLSCALGVSYYLNSSVGTNHQPNVEFGSKLDASGLAEVIATRDIGTDEELLLSYHLDSTVGGSEAVANTSNGAKRQKTQRSKNSSTPQSTEQCCPGCFSGKSAMFWMSGEKQWVPGSIYEYVSVEDRNKCECMDVECDCPKHHRGMYHYSIESKDIDDYFSDDDITVKIDGKRGKELWQSS